MGEVTQGCVHGPGHTGLCKPWDEFWVLASGQEEAFGIFKQGIKKFCVSF